MQSVGIMTVKGVKSFFLGSDVPEKTKCAVKIRIMHAIYLSEFIFSDTDIYPSIAPRSPKREYLPAPRAATEARPKGAEAPRKFERANKKEKRTIDGYLKKENGSFEMRDLVSVAT